MPYKKSSKPNCLCRVIRSVKWQSNAEKKEWFLGQKMKKNQKIMPNLKKPWYNRIKVSKNLQKTKTKTEIHTLPILVHRRWDLSCYDKSKLDHLFLLFLMPDFNRHDTRPQSGPMSMPESELFNLMFFLHLLFYTISALLIDSS